MLFNSIGSRKVDALVYNRGKQAVAFAIIAVLSATAGSVQAQTPAYSLYGSESTAGTSVTIYQYNFAANNSYINQQAYVNTGATYINGLAFSQSTNRLFYRGGTSASTTGNGTFYNYNRGDGVQTAMTRVGGVDTTNLRFADADFYGGYYWAVAGDTNDLYRVSFNATFTTYTADLWLGNVNSGAATDAFTFGDIAIDSGGVLYGFGTVNGNAQFFRGTIPATAGGANGTLTGGTNTGNTLGTATNVQLGLSQDQSILYGATLSDGTWYRIDKTSGARTAISGIANTPLTDLSSAATYQPVPAPPAAVSLGIGGFVGMIGTGVNRLRRNRKKK